MTTIVCSHGFGVQADSKGMFTDISDAFSGDRFVTFDYNIIHDNGDIEAQPLEQQVKKLQTVIDAQDDEVIILAHSQGCIVAGLVDLSCVTKVILLAPPVVLTTQGIAKMLSERSGSEASGDGVLRLPRRNGTAMLVSKQYIASISSVEPLKLYRELANAKPTIIIRATHDEMVGQTQFDGVKAAIIDIAGDHNFTGEARSELVATLRDI